MQSKEVVETMVKFHKIQQEYTQLVESRRVLSDVHDKLVEVFSNSTDIIKRDHILKAVRQVSESIDITNVEIGEYRQELADLNEIIDKY